MKTAKTLCALTLGLTLGLGVGAYSQQDTQSTPKQAVEERKGLYEIALKTPVRYTSQIEQRIIDYMAKHSDIAIRAKMEGGNVIGFDVWAIKTGAGYTGMNQDIENLAK